MNTVHCTVFSVFLSLSCVHTYNTWGVYKGTKFAKVSYFRQYDIYEMLPPAVSDYEDSKLAPYQENLRINK